MYIMDVLASGSKTKRSGIWQLLLFQRLAHLLSVHRKRPRAMPYDHPDGHDALRNEKNVPPYDVGHADQRARTPPPQVGSHADEVDDAARANPPRRRGALGVLGFEHVSPPGDDTSLVGLVLGTVVRTKAIPK